MSDTSNPHPFPRQDTSSVEIEGGVIVPRELLIEVRGLVDVIRERNAIEAHRDQLITQWAAALGASYWVRFILLVMTSRALFGLDIPTLLQWGQAAKDVL